MDPHTEPINLTRNTKSPERLRAWQSNPLRIVAALYPAGGDISGASSIVCQIRNSRADDSSVPAIASVNDTVGSNTEGPWTFDFDTPSMGIDIATGKVCREVFLSVTALWSTGRIETLTERCLEIRRNPYTGSGSTTLPGIALTLTSATTDNEGLLTFTGGGISFRLQPLNRTVLSSPGSATLVLLSATPDGGDLMTVSALDISFQLPAFNQAPAPSAVTSTLILSSITPDPSTGLLTVSALATSFQIQPFN